MSHGVRAYEVRRSRYVGLAKTHLQHVLLCQLLVARLACVPDKNT